MHQLMPEHMVGFRKRSCQRQHDAPLQNLSYTAGGFANVTLERIGLPELGGTGVDDEWLAIGELVIEQAGEAGIPPFVHQGDEYYCRLYL